MNISNRRDQVHAGAMAYIGCDRCRVLIPCRDASVDEADDMARAHGWEVIYFHGCAFFFCPQCRLIDPEATTALLEPRPETTAASGLATGADGGAPDAAANKK